MKVAAILLAAGRSRRMGAFKALLPFGEKTVAETVLENLLAAGVTEIVCVVGHQAAELRTRLAHLPVKFALNEEAESEMGVSIARGVESVSEAASAALIVLVDQPAVPVGAIRQVTDEHLRQGARLVVPTWRGRGGHPVLVSLDFRKELRQLDARRGLRALFDSYHSEVRRVEVESPFVVRDMDTWGDYCALHLEVFGVSPPPLLAADEDGRGA